MFCKNCGNNVEEDAFCSICGAALETGSSYADEMPIAPAQLSGGAKVFSILGMIFGILGAIGAVCCCYYGTFFLPVAIIGLVFSIIAGKKAAGLGVKSPMANVGKICSIVGVAVPVLWIVGIVCFYILYFLGIVGVAASQGSF